MWSQIAVTLFASAALANAHGIVTEVIADGKHYPGTKNWDAPENKNSPVRGIPQDTGFVNYKDVTHSMDIACSSAGYKPRSVVAKVTAGSSIGIRWGGDQGPDKKQWPHCEGPAIAYMGRCPKDDCSTTNPSDVKFFKIAEAGLDTSNKNPPQCFDGHKQAGNGRWAQNLEMKDNSYFWTNIPKDLANGQYLFRHELISLHGAHSRAEGAQYYPSCTQIEIIGGGSSNPQGVPATSLYTEDDGIVNIYEPYPKGINSYKIPGPPLYVAGKSNNNPAPAPSPTKVTSSVVPTQTPPTSKPAAPAPSVKTCKPKRVKRSVFDETRELYERAAAEANARRAHVARHHQEHTF